MIKREVNIDDREITLLASIAEFIHIHKYSPSVRELCQMTNTASTSTMCLLLKKLTEDDLITMVPGMSRTIAINTEKCHISI